MEENLEKEFHVSWYIIIYKFTFGLVEFLLGLGMIFANTFVLPWYKSTVVQELLEDPHDLLANLGQRVIPFILTNRGYLVINLLLLGLAKMAGAVGIIYKKDWGVDLLVGLTVLMFPFQAVSLIRHFSVFGFIYLMMGLLIALYLINFNPKKYAKKLWKSKTK
jgi:uncharacterized membrane protein